MREETSETTPAPEQEGTEETDTSSEPAVETGTNECEECGGSLIANESAGEIVCTKCGLVTAEDLIDHGPEWRSFNAQEKRSRARTGPPRDELRHDKGTSSTIDWRNKDAKGQAITPEKRRQMNRLRKLDSRWKRDSGERTIADAYVEIKRMGSALGIPKSILNTAGSLYRQAHHNNLVPGRSIEAMASSALYAALRVHGEPRSLDEVTAVSRIERKPIQRAYLYICRELDITLEPSDPSKYIPRFATEIGLDQDIIRLAEHLMRDLAGTHHVSGNDPTVLAAASLYAASILDGTLVTQRVIEDAAGVADVSVRNNYEMFLLHSDHSKVTQEDIEATDSVSSLSARINETTEYLSNNRDSPDQFDSNESSTGDDDEPQDSAVENVAYPDEQHNFSCPECEVVKSIYADVTDHIRTKHPTALLESVTRETVAVDPNNHPINNGVPPKEDGEYPCDDCHRAFDSYLGLRIHQGWQHDGRRNTDNTGDRKDHDTQYPDEQFNFMCPDCPRVFTTYRGLSTHIGHKHPNIDKQSRSAYAVDPVEHPEVTQQDVSSEIMSGNTENEESVYSESPDTPPLPGGGSALGHHEAEAFLTDVDEFFERLDHDIHSATIHTARSLLAIGGKDVGDCHYRAFKSAIGAALYAAMRLNEPLTDEWHTQHEIADIVGISPAPIGNGHQAYLAIPDMLVSEIQPVLEE